MYLYNSLTHAGKKIVSSPPSPSSTSGLSHCDAPAAAATAAAKRCETHRPGDWRGLKAQTAAAIFTPLFSKLKRFIHFSFSPFIPRPSRRRTTSTIKTTASLQNVGDDDDSAIFLSPAAAAGATDPSVGVPPPLTPHPLVFLVLPCARRQPNHRKMRKKKQDYIKPDNV